MIRNPNTRNETRYTSTNPPDSEEAAQARIQQLNDEIASIEYDLEHQTVQAFDDLEDFDVWKRRAGSAIKYKKRDIRFLETWLKGRALKKQKAACAQAYQELKSRIASLADSYEQAYSPVFGLHHPAEDTEEVKSRLSRIFAIESQMDADLAQLQESASMHGIKGQEQQEIEQPLRSIVHRVKIESKYLKKVLLILAPECNSFQEDDRARAEKEVAIAQRAEELAGPISKERPVPYDAEHPPADFLEAEARLMLLDKIRRKLQSALKELKDEWQATETYGIPKWTKQPLSQLHKPLDDESAFIKSCIREHNREANWNAQAGMRGAAERGAEEDRSEWHNDLSELNGVVQRIRDQVSELAREIDESYTQVYTGEQPPQSIEEAEQRLAHVLAVKSRLQFAFSEITEAWCTHPLRRGDLPIVKKPLVAILQRVETEIRTIKLFLKQHGATKVPRHIRWKSVCVSALMRASFKGFVLSEEEQEVVKTLLEEISTDSST